MYPAYTFSQGNRARNPGVDQSKDKVNYTIKANNMSYFYVESTDCVVHGPDGLIIQPNTPVKFTSPVAINMNSIFRIGLDYAYFVYDCPNVNPINQRFTITLAGPTVGVVTVPTGYYATRAALATAMQTAIQSLGGGFAAFTVTVDATTQQFLITNAATFSITATEPNTLIFGTFHGTRNATAVGPNFVYRTKVSQLIYTRYIDVLSNAITKYQKGDQTTSRRAANLVERLYTISTSAPVSAMPAPIQFENDNVKMIKYIPDSDIGLVDIELKDEFGNILYYDETLMNFEISLVFIVYNDPTQI